MRFLFLLLILVSCGKIPSLAEVKKLHPSSYLLIEDTNEEVIHETRVNFKKNRRQWMTLKELGAELPKEVVRHEDKRFWGHPGVDLLAILGAMRDYPSRGGSTISMQLAKLITGKHETRSWKGKLRQMNEAIALENSWSKKDILEAYLNLVSFRGELEGIPAASLSIFHKYPRGLSKEERAVLLAMIPSPSQSEDKLFTRSCAYQEKKNCEGLRSVVAEAHSSHDEGLVSLAPHVAGKFRSSGKEVIRTTLKKNFQERATQLLKGHLTLLKKQNVSDGAVLIVERDSGKVLAYVGSSGELSDSPHVDHVLSLRQAGSTLKPFLYAQAISKKFITMNTLLKDEPFTVTREGLTYQPENYQKSFTMKDVPAKIALGSSLNIPAIRVIDYLTPASFHSFLSDLGFRDLQEADFYGHSMALGSVDVTLWDLVSAYRTLSNSGRKSDLLLVENVPKETQVPYLNQEVSFIISHILSEKENRHLTFGFQSSLTTESWSAVKTGTSKDMRDNWCVGYTDRFVIGVWVGNSSGTPMWNVTGISGAAPLFAQLMNELHRKNPSRAPVPPADLVVKAGNYYLAGTEPGDRDLKLTEQHVKRIIFPQNGAQFAYDPEIPADKQRIHFTSGAKTALWKLNGRKLSRHDLERGFLPLTKGKYHLELWEERLLDQVNFYVKAGKVEDPVRKRR